METWYYEVVSIDGDYANLKRTDIESDDLKLVARALLPPEIMEGSRLKYELMQLFYGQPNTRYQVSITSASIQPREHQQIRGYAHLVQVPSAFRDNRKDSKFRLYENG